MAHEQAELNAKKEAPAEEQPLDRQSPVACIFPIDYFPHGFLKIL